jgi:hypothetical protein
VATVDVVARREKMIDRARELDALDAVFALHYSNRRFSGRIAEYGVGRIDLVEALGASAPASRSMRRWHVPMP